MGDQLAKGWADQRAQVQIEKDSKSYLNAQGIRISYTVFGAPSLKPTEAEVQAEEDLLP